MKALYLNKKMRIVFRKSYLGKEFCKYVLEQKGLLFWSDITFTYATSHVDLKSVKDCLLSDYEEIIERDAELKRISVPFYGEEI